MTAGEEGGSLTWVCRADGSGGWRRHWSRALKDEEAALRVAVQEREMLSGSPGARAGRESAWRRSGRKSGAGT